MSLRLYLVVLLCCLVLGVVAVWRRARAVRTGYDVADLLERRRILEDRRGRLEAELEEATSPRALVRTARRLGIDLVVLRRREGGTTTR